MWEWTKAVLFVFFVVPACILAGIANIINWVVKHIQGHEDRKQLEYDQRLAALAVVERERNLLGPNADTVVLEQFITDHLNIFPKWNDIIEPLMDRYTLACSDVKISYEIILPLYMAFVKLYEHEGFNEPVHQGIITGVIELGRHRDELVARANKIKNADKVFEVFAKTTVDVAHLLTRYMPPFAKIPKDEEYPYEKTERQTSVALVDATPRLIDLVDKLVEKFDTEEIREIGLFTKLRKQIHENKAKKIAAPNGRAFLDARLGETPLRKIFEAQVPFEIPLRARLEHTAIVAGSGWGKTQLLQSMISQNLKSDDPYAMVIIDSTGAMVRRVQRLAVFNERLRDRIIIIDPEDTAPPALNMFDLSNERYKTYTAADREYIESEIVSLFNYVFSSIATPLTAQQETTFAFMVRLLLNVPGANIDTLTELLQDNPKEGYTGALPKFREAIDRLDETGQKFFKTQYYSRGTSDARRDQITQRIYAVTRTPAFQRMFSTVNRLDLYEELNRGSIVLVNTSDVLLNEASATFGRYMVARAMAAAFERGPNIPEEERRPAFLIVDEAAPYFDDSFERLLTKIRQFKLGVVIAFQHLEQASQRLRGAIAGSTSVKYAGGVGHTDRNWLAHEMETHPDFIRAQRRDGKEPPQWTQYACYARHFTENAVSLQVPFYQLENMPKMTESEHTALVERNRARIGATPNQGRIRELEDHIERRETEVAAMLGSFIRGTIGNPSAALPPASSNREQIGRALEKLRGTLLPFVDEKLAVRFGKEWPAELNNRNQVKRNTDGTFHKDNALLLRAMDLYWSELFLSHILTRKHRAYLNELIMVRNDFAHDEPFSDDDTERAIDTVDRFVEAVMLAAHEHTQSAINQNPAAPSPGF